MGFMMPSPVDGYEVGPCTYRATYRRKEGAILRASSPAARQKAAVTLSVHSLKYFHTSPYARTLQHFMNRSSLLCAPHAMIHSLPGLVYCAHVDATWTMGFMSEGSMTLTGYSPTELADVLRTCTHHLELLVHPQDRIVVKERITNALRAGERFNLEYRLLHRDGSYRWVQESGIARPDPNNADALFITGQIQDATERREIEAAFREADRRYRSIFEYTVEGLYQSTLEGQIVTANPALARMLGYADTSSLLGEVTDISTQVYVDPARREEFISLILKEGRVRGFESQVFRKDGSIIWISENARSIANDEGQIVLFEGTVEDITRRKLHEAVAHYQSTHDTLTGLLNRDAFLQRLNEALQQREPGQLLAVLYVDVDQFKYVNDSLGHQLGDEYLRLIGSRLCGCIRGSDSIARHGGDEFIILLNGLTSREEAGQIAHDILHTVAQPWTVNGSDVLGSCSIGISMAPSDALDADTMLRHADAAMFRAKALGRNNFRYFTKSLSNHSFDRLDGMNRLRSALANHEFELWYQPKIAIFSAKIVGAEALIRWRNPDGSMMPPYDFIPFAEETGLIVPIGKWVLREACRVNSAWQKAGLRAIPISVNISAIQIERDDLVDSVVRVLEETGLAPHFLELEITESALMTDVQQSIDTLQRLRELGVKCAIDDFGTGYSSLAHLKRFAVDTLKIDRSFIRDISTDRHNAGIVQAVISLAHTLGLTVVAEGVETADEYRHLGARGCDQIQGYYTGRPMPGDALVHLLQSNRR